MTSIRDLGLPELGATLVVQLLMQSAVFSALRCLVPLCSPGDGVHSPGAEAEPLCFTYLTSCLMASRISASCILA